MKERLVDLMYVIRKNSEGSDTK